jgi:hypothetical protein
MPTMLPGEIREDARPLPRRRWLNGGVRFGEGVRERPVYASAWNRLVQAVAADPDWTAWWQGAGAVSLELRPVQSRTGMGRPRVRRRATEVRVECTLDGSRSDADDRDELTAAAARDLLGMLELARRQLDLPALPPLPPVIPEPDHASHDHFGGARGYDVLPQDQEEIIRTMVEVMGIPLEQARAIVATPAPGRRP